MCRRQRGVVQTCPKANRKYSHRCSPPSPCRLDRHKSQLHTHTHSHSHEYPLRIHIRIQRVHLPELSPHICPIIFLHCTSPNTVQPNQAQTPPPTSLYPPPLHFTRCSYLNLTCLSRKLQLQSCVRSRFFLCSAHGSFLWLFYEADRMASQCPEMLCEIENNVCAGRDIYQR